MKINVLKAKTLITMALLASLASCSKDNGNNPSGYSQNTPPAAATGNIRLAVDSKFGSVLTDKNGRTLYSFAVDAANQSNCNGGCAVTWPVFLADVSSLGAGLQSSDFGVITRADNSQQTTYKGWPLYYYSGDVNAGDIKGDGIGKNWFVSKPDYTVMLANEQLVGKDGVSYTSAYVPGTEVVQYLTDDHGRTLYSFSKDMALTNTYTTTDAVHNAVWPVYEASKIMNVPSTLDKSLFTVITVFGKSQVTYKGWPLYSFSADAGVKGSNKGVSVGPGIWPVQNSTTAAAPAVAGSASGSAAGSGY